MQYNEHTTSRPTERERKGGWIDSYSKVPRTSARLPYFSLNFEDGKMCKSTEPQGGRKGDKFDGLKEVQMY